MQAFAQLYYDTALSVTPQQITALRALAPLSRVLYGTDFPFANEARLRMAEGAFAALDLTDDEARMIRSSNALPLFPAFWERCCGAHGVR
jgi:aminocarboxymuconate-semialdehyde decarboxylase